MFWNTVVQTSCNVQPPNFAVFKNSVPACLGCGVKFRHPPIAGVTSCVHYSMDQNAILKAAQECGAVVTAEFGYSNAKSVSTARVARPISQPPRESSLLCESILQRGFPRARSARR